MVLEIMKKIFLSLLILFIGNSDIRAGDFYTDFMFGLNQNEKGIESKFINALTTQSYIDHKQDFDAALYFAIKQNKVKSVKKLFSLGVSPNAIYSNEMLITTAINHQIGNFEDRLAIINLFLEYKVNPYLIIMPSYRNKKEEAAVIKLLQEYKSNDTQSSSIEKMRSFIDKRKKWTFSIGFVAIVSLIAGYYIKNKKSNKLQDK